MNVAGVAKGLAAAESEKALGNQAVARKDRAQAVVHYTEAIEALHDTRAQSPTDDEHKKIKTLLGVCLSNRAAAWLLPGDGQDARKALKDADEAISHSPEYGKACVAQESGEDALAHACSDAVTTARRRRSSSSGRFQTRLIRSATLWARRPSRLKWV